METIPGDKLLKKEVAQVLRSQIFNVAVEFIENPKRGGETTRYTPTNLLLTAFILKYDCRFRFARRWASLDVLVDLRSTLLDLDEFCR